MATPTTSTALPSTTAAAQVARDFFDYLLRHIAASEDLNARQRRALRAAIRAVRQRTAQRLTA